MLTSSDQKLPIGKDWDFTSIAEHLEELVRLAIGAMITIVALALAGRRVYWLSRLIRTGQPAPGRLDGAGRRLLSEIIEVLGQRKLLKWSVPGVAHFLTFWGFLILAFTIVEAFGALF